MLDLTQAVRRRDKEPLEKAVDEKDGTLWPIEYRAKYDKRKYCVTLGGIYNIDCRTKSYLDLINCSPDDPAGIYVEGYGPQAAPPVPAYTAEQVKALVEAAKFSSKRSHSILCDTGLCECGKLELDDALRPFLPSESENEK